MSAGDRDHSRRERNRPVLVVRRQQYGRPGGDGFADHGVEKVAALGIQGRVRLVEQPECGTASHERGERRSTALASAARADPKSGESTLQVQAGECGPHMAHIATGSPNREPHVLRTGEVVVEESGVTEHRNTAPHRPAIRPQVVTQYMGRPRGHRRKPGADLQNRGLSRPVRSPQQDSLSCADLELNAGQCREPVEERHHVTQIHRRRGVDGRAITGHRGVRVVVRSDVYPERPS